MEDRDKDKLIGGIKADLTVQHILQMMVCLFS